jgi:hypothetical protein
MLAKVSWGLGAQSRNNREANLTIGTKLQTLLKVSIELPGRSWKRLWNNREGILTIGTNLQTLVKVSLGLHGRPWNRLWNNREEILTIGTNLQTLVKVSLGLHGRPWNRLLNNRETNLTIGTNLQTLAKLSVGLHGQLWNDPQANLAIAPLRTFSQLLANNLQAIIKSVCEPVWEYPRTVAYSWKMILIPYSLKYILIVNNHS